MQTILLGSVWQRLATDNKSRTPTPDQNRAQKIKTEHKKSKPGTKNQNRRPIPVDIYKSLYLTHSK
jgi:hypothetical protein